MKLWWFRQNLTPGPVDKSYSGKEFTRQFFVLSSVFLWDKYWQLILNSIRKGRQGQDSRKGVGVWPLAITGKYIVVLLSKVTWFAERSEHEVYWGECFTEIHICQQTQTCLKLKEGQNCGRSSSVPPPGFFYSYQDFNQMAFDLSL